MYRFDLAGASLANGKTTKKTCVVFMQQRVAGEEWRIFTTETRRHEEF
jgi:hypothetical protein